jgi:hypothetical protein
LRKIGAINFLPFVVNDTTRTRRSSELSTRRERPFPIPANSEPGLGSSCPWRNYFDISYNGCPAAYIYINRLDINNSGKRGTRHMERINKKLVAVVGATGQQGGAVVRALQAGN